MKRVRFWHVFLLMLVLGLGGIKTFACDYKSHALHFGMSAQGLPMAYWVTYCYNGGVPDMSLGWN